MSILEVPGARLSYETHGSGPLLLMVPGANGDADGFKKVTEHLAAHCTVVTYDRRGFSRSQLDGPQDDDHRLATDADDVRRLIEHVSDAPATLFGSSSGGIVALAVLTHHPSVVHTLVPFEPAAVRVLPDGQKWVDFFFGLYDRYREFGIEPALKEFREQTFAESDWQAMARARDAKNGEYALANATYWFEHELRQYPAVALDLDALNAHADRIVPVAGRESRGHLCYEVSRELGKRLGRDVTELPGGHVGYVTQPAEFAASLFRLLPQTHARLKVSPAGRHPRGAHTRRGRPTLDRGYSPSQVARHVRASRAATCLDSIIVLSCCPLHAACSVRRVDSGWR